MEPLIIRRRILGFLLCLIVPFVGIIEFYFLKKLRRWLLFVVPLNVIFSLLYSASNTVEDLEAGISLIISFIFYIILVVSNILLYYKIHNKIINEYIKQNTTNDKSD